MTPTTTVPPLIPTEFAAVPGVGETVGSQILRCLRRGRIDIVESRLAWLDWLRHDSRYRSRSSALTRIVPRPRPTRWQPRRPLLTSSYTVDRLTLSLRAISRTVSSIVITLAETRRNWPPC